MRLDAYKNDVILIENKDKMKEYMPGIKAKQTKSHTDGHLVIELSSGDKILLCTGFLFFSIHFKFVFVFCVFV